MPCRSKWANKLKASKSWEEVTRQLMFAGKDLTVLSEHERVAKWSISGCESAVWLKLSLDETGSCVQFECYSPSKIVRGLLNVIIEPVQGLSVAEFNAFNFDTYLDSLAFARFLSPSRNNGIHGVLQQLKSYQAANSR